MAVSIKNATVGDGEPLCRSCRYAHIQRGYRESEELIFCLCGWNEIPRLVPFKVRECTHHSDRDMPTRCEMDQMALLIEPATSAKRAGFKRNGSSSAEEHDKEEDTEKQEA